MASVGNLSQVSSLVLGGVRMNGLVSALIGAITFAGAASAAVIDINPYARGCTDAAGTFRCGGSGTATGNYATVIFFQGGGPEEYRGFFLFDLSAITDPILSATLSFDVAAGGIIRVPGRH